MDKKMILLDEFNLYKKYYEMMVYVLERVKKYPKYEKDGLVIDIKNNLYGGMEIVISIHKESDIKNRLILLNKLDVQIKLMSVLIRLSYDNKYINNDNYEAWSRKLTDVSNLMGGLINHCNNNLKKG